MDWRRLTPIAASITALLALIGATAPIVRSDAVPWAGVARVESIRSEIVALHITIVWADYCEAERMRNMIAQRAVSDEIGVLELQYAGLNGGMELPLRPCP